jgi:photosystem II stability/assembly factor-like uncharacterized protein
MIRIVLVLSFLFLALQTAGAQWTQTFGPEGGAAAVILPDGADIYAGTYQAGIFKSTDSGATWQQKINGFGYQSVVAMAKCGPYIIASGTEGLYRSSNGGDSWTLIPGFDALGGVATLAVQGTHVIAGTSYDGVYVSSDTGATWAPSNSGLPPTDDLLWIPSSTSAGSTWFVFAGGSDSVGVHKSTDLGATWIRASSGLPAFDIINVLYYDGSNLFAAGTEVYKSTDMGASWTLASTGIPSFSAISAFAWNGTQLFAVGLNGMFATTNSGTGWTPVTGGLPVMEIKALGVLGTDLFAGTIADGVYKSTDGGAAWSPVNQGLRARSISGLRIYDNWTYANGNGISVMFSDWGSWTDIRGDLPDSASMPTLVYVHDDTLFVHEGYDANALSRSLDYGQTWTRVWPELYNLGTVQNIVRTGSGYWTAVGSIYRSTDEGNTWAAVDSAGTSGALLFSVEQLNGALFAFGQSIYRSTDDGSSWEDVTPSSPSFGQADMMTAAGANLFAGEKYAGVIWRSTDGGSTWGAVPSPAGAATIDQLYGSGTRLFACSDFLGVFQSTNNGTSWTDMTAGLPPDQSAYVVAVQQNLLLAGTGGNSVWKRELFPTTSVDKPADGLPVRTALAQNYPNPFNPSTTITWDVAAEGRVVLKVYDVLGREVATLFDGVSAPGAHAVTWDAGELPGGVYYCRMTAGSSVETKAMMLMR